MRPGLRVLSRSEEATLRLGQALAGGLRPGVVLALHGDLGTGKTVLTRGLARGLGIVEPVTSPTFSVVQEYPRADGTFLFHLDLYRISGEAAALAFGIEEYLFALDGVTVVEWPERIAGLLGFPGGLRRTLRVYLSHEADGVRCIELPTDLAACARDLAGCTTGLALREDEVDGR
jgi:tRNA threonylcarbamoyladenosine biosynthesis protein TsaE